MYCVHARKEPQEPSEHTSEHVKSQNFLGACPQPPSYNPFCGAPLFVFALGPPNPLGGHVQSYSQSQARLMFVTTLGMDKFDCTKMNANYKKFTTCLWEGLIHEWKQALITPPHPLMSLNNSQLCSTHNQRSAPLGTRV